MSSDDALEFGPETPAEAIAAWVDAVRGESERRHELVALLPEQSTIYAGRGTRETANIRGYILASFERMGLPEVALPYVLEELESGHEAYLVAAAAKALRGAHARESRYAGFLLRALQNFRSGDDAVTFAVFQPQWPLVDHTSAVTEILETIAWLGGYAGTIVPDLAELASPTQQIPEATRRGLARAIERARGGVRAEPAAEGRRKTSPVAVRALPGSLADLPLEDQDGQRCTFGASFTGRPTIVAFFYTRCENPDKCSSTITRMAELQRLIAEESLLGVLRLATITYDPNYDLPMRLKAYCTDRGVVFGDHVRSFRALSERFVELRAWFELGVGYSSTVVNRHRIELYILDAEGAIVGGLFRQQYTAEQVLSYARGLLAGPTPTTNGTWTPASVSSG